MIFRARFVVTMDGDPIENGAVAIRGNRISDVGTCAEITKSNSGEVTDLGEVALLPGLINAHCHLDYGMLRGAIPPQSSFIRWINEINVAKGKLRPADYQRAISDGFAEAKNFGTTTIANFAAFPELLPQMPPPLRMWWFGELIDIRGNVDVAGILQDLRQGADHGNSRGGLGLAPHALYTASCPLFKEVAKVAHHEGFLLSTHLAESREEMEMFRDAAGPMFDGMRAFGRPMHDCGGRTPLEVLSGCVKLDQRWIIAHLNELTNDDFTRLGSADRFNIAHCPRSHRYFGHSRFQFQNLRELGYNIALGTDSLASNQNLSLFAEMREFRRIQPGTSPRELLRMVTVNAAVALSQQDRLGRIRRGYLADLIAVPVRRPATEIYDEVTAYDEVVPWMLLDGNLQTFSA